MIRKTTTASVLIAAMLTAGTGYAPADSSGSSSFSDGESPRLQIAKAEAKNRVDATTCDDLLTPAQVAQAKALLGYDDDILTYEEGVKLMRLAASYGLMDSFADKAGLSGDEEAAFKEYLVALAVYKGAQCKLVKDTNKLAEAQVNAQASDGSSTNIYSLFSGLSSGLSS